MFDQVLPNAGIAVQFIDLTDVEILHKLITKKTKVSRRAFESSYVRGYVSSLYGMYTFFTDAVDRNSN